MQYPPNQGGQGGPGGMSGMGGAPAPRQAGPQMGGPSQPITQQEAGYQPPYSPQGNIDDLQAQLLKLRMTGASPLAIGQLEQKIGIANRGMGQLQNRQYGEEMGKLTNRGAGSVGTGGRGGRPGQSQIDQNPYLEMLLRNRLGMGQGGRSAW